MTPDELLALERLATAATPGPRRFWDKRGRELWNRPERDGGRFVGHTGPDDWGVVIAGSNYRPGPTVADGALHAALSLDVVLRLIAEVRAAREDDLGAAWAESEAALPEGWELWGVKRRVGKGHGPHGAAEAWAGPPGHSDMAKHGYGSTPAAALRALAETLRSPE